VDPRSEFATEVAVDDDAVVHKALSGMIRPDDFEVRCEDLPHRTFAYAGVVVLTMLAVESFDPRLIWDGVITREGASMEEVADG